jgi:hypothetical protein
VRRSGSPAPANTRLNAQGDLVALCHLCRRDLTPPRAVVVPDGRYFCDPALVDWSAECLRLARRRLGLRDES